ncbi:MAG TPA: hypothetical protein VFG10_02695 [Saprospiraceae bacterium]|nr:hypothetical protein [Saprospiraceae bacterium]
MISKSTNKGQHASRTLRDILVIILVFILLTAIIWRWFDYRIARINHPATRSSHVINVNNNSPITKM